MRIPIHTHPVKPIFISYRRDDSIDITGRIRDRLATVFGDKRVYRDLDSIPAGLDFRQELNKALAQCGTMLVIVGPKWAGQDRNRLLEARDLVRQEVATALERGIYVVPVLIGGAELPPLDELPPEMHALHARNNIRLDGARDFDTHARQLISLIDRFGRGTVDTGGPARPKEEIPPFPISLAPANASRWFLLPLCWAALGLLATLLSVALLRLLAPHGAPVDPRNVLHALALVLPLGAALWGCGAVVARSSLASHDLWSAALIFQLAAFVAGLLTLRVANTFAWSPALTSASVALVITLSQFIAWHPVLNAQRGITYLVAFPFIVFGLHVAGEGIIPHSTFVGQLLWRLVEFGLMGGLFVWATSKVAQRSATIEA